MTSIFPFLKGKTPGSPFMKGRLGGILKWLNGYEISDFRFSNLQSEIGSFHELTLKKR
jgi:hypothetical protein